MNLQKGNETPRPEPQETPAVSPNPVAEVSEQLTKVTRYRAPDPIVDDLAETIKPYTSVKCTKEAKEVYLFFIVICLRLTLNLPDGKYIIYKLNQKIPIFRILWLLSVEHSKYFSTKN